MAYDLVDSLNSFKGHKIKFYNHLVYFTLLEKNIQTSLLLRYKLESFLQLFLYDQMSNSENLNLNLEWLVFIIQCEVFNFTEFCDLTLIQVQLSAN
jgi:hypothetical protein